MKKLEPCPFCGANLIHVYGKRINKYYSGEPTLYEHPQTDDCILGKYGKTARVHEDDLELWNRRMDG